MELASSSDATITLKVDRFISVRQGTMWTSGTSPEVTATLTANPSGRASQSSNHSFEVTGSTPGGSPLDLRIEVLPFAQYEAVGLIVTDPSGTVAGSAHWDNCKVGDGANANAVTVRDWCRKGAATPPDPYRLYMLIKTKVPDGQLGDYGLIDPLITNF